MFTVIIDKFNRFTVRSLKLDVLPVGIFSALSGVGLSSDPVHGHGQSGVGLDRDAAKGHRTCGKSPNNAGCWFNLK
jgi:hypothetical protein